ncbi:MAG: orotate phosphoribosyltransferase [Alphaproteobacteria bacterium]|nr:orotate phosphoribosyltransferase [Alphaproteobacteria bacterium]
MIPASQSEAFARFLASSAAVRFGDFTLKSGKKSNVFFNFGDLCAGRELSEMGAHFANAIVALELQRSGALFGPAYKGINLALATAVALWRDHGVDMPVAYNRKEAKAHGEGGSIVGADLSKAGSVIVLDDVITDGATKYDVIEMLRAFPGLTIAAMLVGVDRQDADDTGRAYIDVLRSQTGVRVEALATREQVLQCK